MNYYNPFTTNHVTCVMYFLFSWCITMQLINIIKL